MEKCYSPLLCTIVPNFLVLFLSFAGVTSAPVSMTIMSVMRNDSNLCEASKFLYESAYVQECAEASYPVKPIQHFELELGTFLCLGIYDTAYKICQYSSQRLIPTNVSAIFDSYMKLRLALDAESQAQKAEFCGNLQGYILHNKTNDLWEPLVENINAPDKCIKVCFDFSDKLRPLCAALGWIKNLDDAVKKANKPETRHDVAPDSQLNDETISNDKTVATGARTSEVKEIKEQAPKPAASKDDSNVKAKNPDASSNAPTAPVKTDAEEINSNIIAKLSKDEVQKKTNKTEVQDHKSLAPSAVEKEGVVDSGVNGEVAKPAKDISGVSNPQVASVKNVAGNTPSKEIVSQGNAQQYEKEHDIDDVKTSTISENTQDHYPEEDVESNRGDMDGTDVDEGIQQPIDIGKEALSDGGRNDLLPEIAGPKDTLQYSNARIEDESHFFTYFTVITVACIAGYIGYHNKQKILAIVLEGRRSRSSRSRRRPSTASYRKLDCTLEEAVTSQCNANVTHVIY